jgi:DNA replication protein DnaC
MSADTTALQHSMIQQACKQLRLPGIGAQFQRLAAQAARARQGYRGYLDARLSVESEARARHTVTRRLKAAHLPRLKTLEEFDFSQAPQISPRRLAALAAGGYLARAEPVVFLGDSGTGKTHLLTALGVAAGRQKPWGRFASAAGLVNELVEATHQLQLRRVLARWAPSTRSATSRWPRWGPNASSR